MSRNSKLFKANVISEANGLTLGRIHPPADNSKHGPVDVEAGNTNKTPTSNVKINEDTVLSAEAQKKLKEILIERRHAFVGEDGKLGSCTLYELKLQLKPGATPFRKRQYHMSPLLREEASKQIKDFLSQGVLEYCESEFSSPPMVVTKGQKRTQTCRTRQIQTDL